MECKENYQLLKKKLQSELLETLETGGEWSDEEIMGQIDEPVSYTHLTLPTNREV